MNPFKVGTVIFFIGFLIFFFVAAALFFSQTKFIDNSLTTKGKVIKIVEDNTDKKHKTLYSPIIEYIDSKGEFHKGQLSTWSTDLGYSIGDSLK